MDMDVEARRRRDARDKADGQPFVFENLALLDVELEKGVQRFCIAC